MSFKRGRGKFQPGQQNFSWTGKGMFGYKPGQIMVHALGAAKDRIRLTDVSTGETRTMDRIDYENLKEEVRLGNFVSQETFWKASYHRTTEGKIGADKNLIRGFTTAIHSRYQHASLKEIPLVERQYIIELFEQMTLEQRKNFMDIDGRLFSQIKDYEEEIVMDEDYKKGLSEYQYIQKKLESYLKPEEIRRARNLARMRV